MTVLDNIVCLFLQLFVLNSCGVHQWVFIALFYALGNDLAREEELGRIVTVLDNKEV